MQTYYAEVVMQSYTFLNKDWKESREVIPLNIKWKPNVCRASGLHS